MADEVSDFRFFTNLAGAGSLSEAARKFNSSPAATSRRLAQLEKRLGVRLVARTTRRFELTPEGLMLNDRAAKIIADIEQIEAEASAGAAVPRGPLRVGVQYEIGRRRFAPLIADFVDRHPEVRAQLFLSDAALEIAADNLDVVFYIGLPADQDLTATKVLASPLVICAAPSYLEKHGTPRRPRDVADHNCILFRRGQRTLDTWSFEEDGRPLDVRVSGNLTATSTEVVHDWVLAGKGLALKPLWDIEDEVAAGRLVICLVPYRRAMLTVNAVFRKGRYLPPRVRLFIDFIKERLGSGSGAPEPRALPEVAGAGNAAVLAPFP